MPKPGFKSITVTNFIYEKMHQEYIKVKDELSLKGITSFSGYLTLIFTKHLEVHNAS